MAHQHHEHDHEHAAEMSSALSPANHSLKDYLPLLVVFAFITVSAAAHVAVVGNSLLNWMMAIMGYFFLLFSLFKLIDLPGFKEGFHHYDVVAQRFENWGYLYPFIELMLGVLYLVNIQHPLLYGVTLLVTILNVTGVAIKLAKKETFMCACLGTLLKVPLTTVTLVEYAVMGLMAIVMFWL